MFFPKGVNDEQELFMGNIIINSQCPLNRLWLVYTWGQSQLIPSGGPFRQFFGIFFGVMIFCVAFAVIECTSESYFWNSSFCDLWKAQRFPSRDCGLCHQAHREHVSPASRHGWARVAGTPPKATNVRLGPGGASPSSSDGDDSMQPVPGMVLHQFPNCLRFQAKNYQWHHLKCSDIWAWETCTIYISWFSTDGSSVNSGVYIWLRTVRRIGSCWGQVALSSWKLWKHVACHKLRTMITFLPLTSRTRSHTAVVYTDGLEELKCLLRVSRLSSSSCTSRMRSKGSRFTLGVWGLRVCSLDVAFTSATVRNRPYELRMAVPMGSFAEVVLFGGFRRLVASFRVAGVALRDIQTCSATCRKSLRVAGAILLRRFQKMCCSFRGRRSILDVSIVIFRGRRSTLDVSFCVFL